jgi:hypothetical protein
MRALRALLHGIVDYAGLFPPAALPMRPTVQRYAAYRSDQAAWMLGRLVVPVARLEEFEAAAGALLPPPIEPDDVEAEPPAQDPADAGDGILPSTGAPWRLAALLGGEPDRDVALVRAFNARHAPGAPHGHAVIDVVEGRVARVDDVAALARAAGTPSAARPGASPLVAYAEPPIGADPEPFAAAAAAAGVRLKLRTGGVTADAFPEPEAVLAILAASVRHGVACKATAGLHHPLAGEHPLTYEPGCPRATMFGFVGVFLAATLLRAGHPAAALAPLLGERDPASFVLTHEAITWRGRSADVAALASARAHALASFGSCSFDEPVADLRALGWWPA